MRKTRTVAALLGLLVFWCPRTAWPEDLAATCAVPAALSEPDFPLEHVAAKLKSDELVSIVVMGSGSSAGMGASAVSNAYSERLDIELRKRFPKGKFKVVNLSKRGQLAADMVSRFSNEVARESPALVIWQTGTVDAVRAVDLTQFGRTLEAGLDELGRHGSDVILMDMQYSPYTSTALDVSQYRDYMRWAAQDRGTTLFDRFAMMQLWTETGVINFTNPAKSEQARYADLVHGCIAYLLAAMIESAVAPELGPNSQQ